MAKYKGILWAYGVTTVPSRRGDLLPQTLASLGQAGFDKPRLFVDGDRDPQSWEREFGLETTARHPTIRTFGNWTLGLAELYIREPTAQRFAMFQDDFVTYRNLRAYLEKCEYPGSGERGYWNLYTFPPPRQLAPPPKVGWFLSNQRGKGAVALVFSREAVITLLTHEHFVERPISAERGWRAIDGGIVTALSKAGWKEYVHNPSLVQHVGRQSSMGSRPFEQATSFRGEDFDALEL